MIGFGKDGRYLWLRIGTVAYLLARPDGDRRFENGSRWRSGWQKVS